MTKVPSFTAKEIVKLLHQKGFVLDRIKGSHHIYRLPDGSKKGDRTDAQSRSSKRNFSFYFKTSWN